MALWQVVTSIHSPASLDICAGTHLSLLATQVISAAIIEEQNEKYNKASSGAGACAFSSVLISTFKKYKGIVVGDNQSWESHSKNKV